MLRKRELWRDVFRYAAKISQEGSRLGLRLLRGLKKLPQPGDFNDLLD
jgi:hypothetical protein